MYPMYDQLAAEVGQNATLIKVDTSKAFDVGQRFGISATPTFATFLRGKEQERWSGADAARLRGTVGLLIEMAHPKHPHELLRLPHFANPNIEPVLYTKIPPLEKLLAKLGTQATSNASVQDVKRFIDTRTKEGPAQVSLSSEEFQLLVSTQRRLMSLENKLTHNTRRRFLIFKALPRLSTAQRSPPMFCSQRSTSSGAR